MAATRNGDCMNIGFQSLSSDTEIVDN